MKKIRYIPYGYTMRNGKTVVEHGEADVIREIFDAYIGGSSLKSIAEELTARKIPYSERTDIWDKARIARIIDNAKYLGDNEFDQIIEEERYETAVNLKIARQRNTCKKDCASIELLREYVRCGKCGARMSRRISSKHRIRESWMCSTPACGCKVRIGDNQLLEKLTILMNRMICNTRLLVPKTKSRLEMPPAVQKLNNEISRELEQETPSEDLVISKVIAMAGQLYQDSNAKLHLAASIARKRVENMTLQDEFNSAYFTDLIAYITIDEDGKVKLITKTDTEIGEECNESDSNT